MSKTVADVIVETLAFVCVKQRCWRAGRHINSVTDAIRRSETR